MEDNRQRQHIRTAGADSARGRADTRSGHAWRSSPPRPAGGQPPAQQYATNTDTHTHARAHTRTHGHTRGLTGNASDLVVMS